MAADRPKLPKVTVRTLAKKKADGDRIAMVTAYDATFARLADQAGVDVLLVGDSVGMVVQGQSSTLPVTMDEMVYHCRAVARGAERAQVVGDMPFMSYQASIEDGLRNAGRLVKEGGAEAIKLEGGREHVPLVERLVQIGIPVMGHIGLTPQSVHAMGGFRVQGRSDAQAARLLDDARALDQAGCYALVLEGIPRELAARISSEVRCATIGIGAGVDCHGQVLVLYDLLGMDESFRPKFVKRYDNLAVRIRTAVEGYVSEVRAGQFPDEEHSFGKDAPPRADATPYGGGQRAAAGAREDPEATGAACIPLPLRPLKR
jgi:3-methyl-2-oxobutanoate hydroxymethyltransferase